jgi:hypothetical protein
MDRYKNYEFKSEEERENAMNANLSEIDEILPNKLYELEEISINMIDADEWSEVLESNGELKSYIKESGKVKTMKCKVISFFNTPEEFRELMQKPGKIVFDKSLIKDPRIGMPLVYDKKSLKKIKDRAYELIIDWKVKENGEKVALLREYRLYKQEMHIILSKEIKCINCEKESANIECISCKSVWFCSKKCEKSAKSGSHSQIECNLLKSRRVI